MWARVVRWWIFVAAINPFTIFQIRSQLTQEFSLNLEAFQNIDELPCQVYDLEAAVSQRNVTAGKDRLYVATCFLRAVSLMGYVPPSWIPP